MMCEKKIKVKTGKGELTNKAHVFIDNLKRGFEIEAGLDTRIAPIVVFGKFEASISERVKWIVNS